MSSSSTTGREKANDDDEEEDESHVVGDEEMTGVATHASSTKEKETVFDEEMETVVEEEAGMSASSINEEEKTSNIDTSRTSVVESETAKEHWILSWQKIIKKLQTNNTNDDILLLRQIHQFFIQEQEKQNPKEEASFTNHEFLIISLLFQRLTRAFACRSTGTPSQPNANTTTQQGTSPIPSTTQLPSAAVPVQPQPFSTTSPPQQQPVVSFLSIKKLDLSPKVVQSLTGFATDLALLLPSVVEEASDLDSDSKTPRIKEIVKEKKQQQENNKQQHRTIIEFITSSLNWIQKVPVPTTMTNNKENLPLPGAIRLYRTLQQQNNNNNNTTAPPILPPVHTNNSNNMSFLDELKFQTFCYKTLQSVSHQIIDCIESYYDFLFLLDELFHNTNTNNTAIDNDWAWTLSNILFWKHYNDSYLLQYSSNNQQHPEHNDNTNNNPRRQRLVASLASIVLLSTLPSSSSTTISQSQQTTTPTKRPTLPVEKNAQSHDNVNKNNYDCMESSNDSNKNPNSTNIHVEDEAKDVVRKDTENAAMKDIEDDANNNTIKPNEQNKEGRRVAIKDDKKESIMDSLLRSSHIISSFTAWATTNVITQGAGKHKNHTITGSISSSSTSSKDTTEGTKGIVMEPITRNELESKVMELANLLLRHDDDDNKPSIVETEKEKNQCHTDEMNRKERKTILSFQDCLDGKLWCYDTNANGYSLHELRLQSDAVLQHILHPGKGLRVEAVPYITNFTNQNARKLIPNLCSLVDHRKGLSQPTTSKVSKRTTKGASSSSIHLLSNDNNYNSVPSFSLSQEEHQQNETSKDTDNNNNNKKPISNHDSANGNIPTPHQQLPVTNLTSLVPVPAEVVPTAIIPVHGTPQVKIPYETELLLKDIIGKDTSGGTKAAGNAVEGDTNEKTNSSTSSNSHDNDSVTIATSQPLFSPTTLRLPAPPAVITEGMELNEWTVSLLALSVIKPSTRLILYLDAPADPIEKPTTMTTENLNDTTNTWRDIMIPLLNHVLLRIITIATANTTNIAEKERSLNGASNASAVKDDNSDSSTSVTACSKQSLPIFIHRYSGQVMYNLDDKDENNFCRYIANGNNSDKPDIQICVHVIAFYYHALEAILYFETKRLASASHPNLVFSEAFHRALLSCCYLCVYKAIGNPSGKILTLMTQQRQRTINYFRQRHKKHQQHNPYYNGNTFSSYEHQYDMDIFTILHITESTPYAYMKVTESFYRALSLDVARGKLGSPLLSGLPRILQREMKFTEVQVIESLIWSRQPPPPLLPEVQHDSIPSSSRQQRDHLRPHNDNYDVTGSSGSIDVEKAGDCDEEVQQGNLMQIIHELKNNDTKFIATTTTGTIGPSDDTNALSTSPRPSWPPEILLPTLPEELEDATINKEEDRIENEDDDENCKNSTRINDCSTDRSNNYPDYIFLTYILRKILKIAYLRIQSLCQQCILPRYYNIITTQAYVAFRYLLRNHIELVYDRHIDQLILSTIYGVCKIMKLKPELTFARIIEVYIAIKGKEIDSHHNWKSTSNIKNGEFSDGERICQTIVRHVKISSDDNNNMSPNKQKLAKGKTNDNKENSNKNSKCTISYNTYLKSRNSNTCVGNVINLHNSVLVPTMKKHLLHSRSLKRNAKLLAKIMNEENENGGNHEVNTTLEASENAEDGNSNKQKRMETEDEKRRPTNILTLSSSTSSSKAAAAAASYKDFAVRHCLNDILTVKVDEGKVSLQLNLPIPKSSQNSNSSANTSANNRKNNKSTLDGGNPSNISNKRRKLAENDNDIFNSTNNHFSPLMMAPIFDQDSEYRSFLYFGRASSKNFSLTNELVAKAGVHLPVTQ